MKNIYRIEIGRAYKSRRMFLALVVGMIISMYHSIAWLPQMQFLNDYALSEPNSYPTCAYLNWIGGNCYTWQTYFYYLIIPLIATIPYGTSLFDDRKHGFDKNYILRTGKAKYYRAKFFAIFLSGGTAVVIPLIFNFMVTALFYPTIVKPQVSAGDSFVTFKTMFYKVHFTHPILYILIYLVITFVMAGLCAEVSMIISRLTNYKFLVEVGPVFIYVFFVSVFELISKKAWSPSEYLVTCNSESSIYVVFVEALILMIITFGFVLSRGKYDEIF